MATRRNVPNYANDDKNNVSPAAGEKSDIAPAVPAHVIYKLLGFTLAMVAGPIGSYFLTLNLVFGGNSTWAGATAAIVANLVLVGYVIVAMKEDQTEAMGQVEEERKKL